MKRGHFEKLKPGDFEKISPEEIDRLTGGNPDNIPRLKLALETGMPYEPYIPVMVFAKNKTNQER